MRIFTNIIAVLLILLASAGIAALVLDPLTRLGAFGSCFEGGCGYGAVFVGFPVITLLLTVIGCLVWFIWRRGR